MARTDTGKWVARAAATGGSRTYRGQRPVKWYSSLALICILGVALVWYSRYEKQHPSSAGQPAVGASWYAALSFDICGTVEPALPATPTVKGKTPGLTSVGSGVIHIAPRVSSEAGANATLGLFASEYPGMALTSTTVRYPGKTSAGPTVGRTFTLGQKCPKGTKDAGKPGIVQAVEWTTPTAKASIAAGDPPSLKLADQQEITIAFLPKGVAVPRPPGTAVAAMLRAVSAAASGSSGAATPAAGSGAVTPPTGSGAVTPPTGSGAVTPPTGSGAATPAAGSGAATPAAGSGAATPAAGSGATSSGTANAPARSSGTSGSSG